MSKINEAREILKILGLPAAQQNEMSALTLLALCGIGPNDPWKKAQCHSVTISKGVMSFVAERYDKKYAPNTRETFRRQVLHQFVQAGIADYNPDDPNLATNSPKAHYGLTKQALETIKSYGTRRWKAGVKKFLIERGSLLTAYKRNRLRQLVPVHVAEGVDLRLSPGRHNEVQAAVIQEFAPRFAPGACVLYLGDTAKKNLYVDGAYFDKLGIPITDHDKLPDVVLCDEDRSWLFLIEAVTSHGPVTPKRIIEMEEMFGACGLGRIYVTAFPDFAGFRKHLRNIAWETEVWIVEMPDHMIHFNGDRFLGPR